MFWCQSARVCIWEWVVKSLYWYRGKILNWIITVLYDQVGDVILKSVITNGIPLGMTPSSRWWLPWKVMVEEVSRDATFWFSQNVISLVNSYVICQPLYYQWLCLLPTSVSWLIHSGHWCTMKALNFLYLSPTYETNTLTGVSTYCRFSNRFSFIFVLHFSAVLNLAILKC